MIPVRLASHSDDGEGGASASRNRPWGDPNSQPLQGASVNRRQAAGDESQAAEIARLHRLRQEDGAQEERAGWDEQRHQQDIGGAGPGQQREVEDVAGRRADQRQGDDGPDHSRAGEDERPWAVDQERDWRHDEGGRGQLPSGGDHG